MPKLEERPQMPIQVSIPDDILTEGKQCDELEKAIREGLIIRAYLNAEISIGELAELMNMEYIQARDWLHDQGIATTRKLPSDLEETDQKNMEKLAKELDISLD
jgi:predicted HTH domain antitoxin